MPATVFLRFEDPRASLETGSCAPRVEIYTPDEATTVAVDGRDVPLEFETTSSLAGESRRVAALGLRAEGLLLRRPSARSPTWCRPRSSASRSVEEENEDEGLLFLQPYRRGHIPVVLVHGTASSPARWANLVNELLERARDPRALPDLALPLQHGQPDRLFGGAAAPRARARRRALRSGGHRPRAARHGGDRAQPGRPAHEAHRRRQRQRASGISSRTRRSTSSSSRTTCARRCA